MKDAITTHIKTLLESGEPVEITKSKTEALQQNPDHAGGIWALVHLDLENWTASQNPSTLMYAAHDPTVIPRRNGEPVVTLSVADFNDIEETLYLLSSPKNAKRLMESFEQFKSGMSKKR